MALELLCTFENLTNVTKYSSILILFRIAKRCIARHNFMILDSFV